MDVFGIITFYLQCIDQQSLQKHELQQVTDK